MRDILIDYPWTIGCFVAATIVGAFVTEPAAAVLGAFVAAGLGAAYSGEIRR